MAKSVLKCGDVELPSPVSITSGDEIIWSKNTGRSDAGNMVGDVVAEKKDLTINWGILTENELKTIKNNLIAGFFPITFRDDGKEVQITAYRGVLTKEHLGYIGDGIYYYKSANVQIVQK